jgi:glycine/D-amino acid oxidase-like deaminating enzyme
VWVATGHGANGLLLGPYSALLVAARMAPQADERCPTLPAEFDPSRFI